MPSPADPPPDPNAPPPEPEPGRRRSAFEDVVLALLALGVVALGLYASGVLLVGVGLSATGVSAGGGLLFCVPVPAIAALVIAVWICRRA